ncbi:MAG: serine/threonine-protein kinase [Planctomycetota bacterium]|jgi:serine/threonine protein kinase/cytochrome c-type biogenesis protein CcmH/NrfG|nr:serine/threonine-protein kinase [Planctomycetota bacterium]MDP6519732.1 serine/threonine-protein kinase [Planctomycetota bacterium]MDP6837314.1 serine/threonine-protein kinase [Planctomycetota bacterium]
MKFAHFQFDPQQDLLGEGPLSEVYRARDTKLGRTVALKILRAHAEIDPEADQRFLREAVHTSGFAHENIATVFEYGEDHGTSFIAMEYLRGRTLDALIAERPLPYEEGLRIARQVTAALQVVHAGSVVHRDLKPGNIMLLDDGSVKLLDFGIARASGDTKITQHGMLVGTVLYMSPEQVRGDDLDSRSDIFSLGAVLYHALTGQLPFPGKSFPAVCMSILDGSVVPPSQIRRGFPGPLEAMILKCLKPETEERPQSLNEVDIALQAASDVITPRSIVRASRVLRAKLAIEPFQCGGEDDGACHRIVGSLRKDIADDLARTKTLSISILEPDESIGGAGFDFMLGGSFTIEGHAGSLELQMTAGARAADGAYKVLWREKIEHSESDEWTLQGALVRAAVRTVRRRISELALSPDTSSERDPEAAQALSLAAHEILHRGTTRHLLGATTRFRRALELDSYCALAYAGLAEAKVHKYLHWDGDPTFIEEAREHAARALALDPSCAEARTSLGFAYHITGRAADAMREYRLAIQLDGDEWFSHRLLGALLGRQGNYKHATPLLQRAITLRPAHIGSYDHLFQVLLQLGRKAEAVEVAEQGIAAAHLRLSSVRDDQESRLHLASLLARLERPEQARAAAADALEVFPRDGYTAFHSSVVYAMVGDLEAALEHLAGARQRGFFIRSEMAGNSDLDPLRGLPEFDSLGD